jgi:hypothetical protein
LQRASASRRSDLRGDRNHKNLDKAWLDLLRAGAPQRDVDRASDAEEKAAWKIARTTPTTATGAAELLEYIAIAGGP